MGEQLQQRANLLQGTLNMLILRTLLYGTAYGRHIGTDKGRKQLVVEESECKQMAEGVARVMWPAAEES